MQPFGTAFALKAVKFMKRLTTTKKNCIKVIFSKTIKRTGATVVKETSDDVMRFWRRQEFDTRCVSDKHLQGRPLNDSLPAVRGWKALETTEIKQVDPFLE